MLFTFRFEFEKYQFTYAIVGHTLSSSRASDGKDPLLLRERVYLFLPLFLASDGKERRELAIGRASLKRLTGKISYFYSHSLELLAVKKREISAYIFFLIKIIS